MSLYLIEGPAGGGKSQYVAEMLAAGEISILSDVTALWAALGGYQRDPITGLYPVREDGDPALELALYTQAVAVRQGLEMGEDVAVTTSRRNQVSRWRTLAYSIDVDFILRTVDPGEDVVRARLTDGNGNLSDDCRRAIARWYGEESS